ncbi:phosphoenolpyruvate carboxykinase (ATP) [Fibrivirga algicola]|uniref:Phosphoenolpyruvate carboxykinase (ATP) n=1 Tax=Fibrivirga algicola TaxID=2950420 RepID=A0ABX0QN43_9BACT|nr:phosphoenolpyruvate carboxykinase (ATP) [Fibrivirga algicola]NID11534.1 phosphoenolpyruvate carboxykinase (ATP) [Fibrivirga algicola]
MVIEQSQSFAQLISLNFPADNAIDFLQLAEPSELFFQLSPAALIEQAVQRGEGQLTDTGALLCTTGRFTGRSPKDRYIVRDELTADTVDWGNVNIPFSAAKFDQLHRRMRSFLEYQTVYVRYARAGESSPGADPAHQLNLCILTTAAWQNLFCHNMFQRVADDELNRFKPDFTVLAVPGFKAIPTEDSTRAENFALLNLSKRILLIGGTCYAGEIKKGIFSALNYLLPSQNVLPMHCSANVGERDGKTDVALFFGLSGTGKTTLSADPNRALIGDDEHGWSETGVFNFEGGCYAKVVDLTREREPQIYDAIRYGAIVENTRFAPGTSTVNYSDTSLTENTRTSYPIDFINNARIPSVAGHPKTIFFLTCDAFGVLPPIARLTPEQAMQYFLLGYTAKVAGTEMGVTEPKATFSACFGAAFMPLTPGAYAKMLGDKIREHDTDVWLINTGWTGGGYGVGKRVSLTHTRALISAVLSGRLDPDRIQYRAHPIFGLAMPATCPDVPNALLDPRQTWVDTAAYDEKAMYLQRLFDEKQQIL